MHHLRRLSRIRPIQRKEFEMQNALRLKRGLSQILLGLVGLTVVLFTFLAATPFALHSGGDQGGLDGQAHQRLGGPR